ncbi:hypothetical protein ACHAC9_03645 [Massilia sp. CMS3.1]|uniref:hypothetical protein n=1 Tax=Massilia sp. CMS3.1 TaxID=3373083 RepID=UPI003EE7C48B
MTGSEKADGYSRDVFVGLDPQEKEEVFRLLVTELPFSTEWLFFLDKEKALVIVKEKEEKLRGNSYSHVYMIQEELLKYSGGMSYQDRMIEDYPSYVDYLRPLVVDSIGRTPANMAAVNFFKQVILTETNDDAVARAARKLLGVLKFPRDTEANDKYYKRLVSELRSESTILKLQALSQIAKYEKNLPVDG